MKAKRKVISKKKAKAVKKKRHAKRLVQKKVVKKKKLSKTSKRKVGSKKVSKTVPKKAKRKAQKKTVWKISPEKHSTQDVWVFKKDGVTIVMRQNYQFSFLIVNKKPNLTKYDPEKGVNIGKFNYIHFEPGDDSFGYDWTFPDDFPLEEQERIESLFQEGYHDAMEEAGWRIVEDETYVFGDLSVEEVESEDPYDPV